MPKIHRFFLNTGFIEGELHITDVELTHQMRDVLKLHSGEECVLFNGTGQEARAIIEEYIDSGTRVMVKNVIKKDEEKTKVILYCAVLKRENFEMVVQKATELGVFEIVPTITARTIKTGLKQSRLEKIATEASEQSGRISIPLIHKPMDFSDALLRAQDHAQTIVLHTEGGEITQPNFKGKIESVGLFIGPEGGFSNEEITQAQEYNYHIHTFPNMILRGETAAIVGTFWVKGLVGNN